MSTTESAVSYQGRRYEGVAGYARGIRFRRETPIVRTNFAGCSYIISLLISTSVDHLSVLAGERKMLMGFAAVPRECDVVALVIQHCPGIQIGSYIHIRCYIQQHQTISLPGCELTVGYR